MLKRVADQKQKELDSCVEKIRKLEEMKNKNVNPILNIVFFLYIYFLKNIGVRLSFIELYFYYFQKKEKIHFTLWWLIVNFRCKLVL